VGFIRLRRRWRVGHLRDYGHCALERTVSIQHKYVRDPVNYSLEGRARELRAASGPTHTFSCKGCDQFKSITGRKRVGKSWRCAQCASKSKESGNAA
jgi:hypothetical protein